MEVAARKKLETPTDLPNEISISPGTIDNKHYTQASSGSISIKATVYGNINEYIVASYSGTVIDSASNTKTISENFRLKTR